MREALIQAVQSACQQFQRYFFERHGQRFSPQGFETRSRALTAREHTMPAREARTPGAKANKANRATVMFSMLPDSKYPFRLAVPIRAHDTIHFQGRKFMWIVRLALRRPYTFVIMALLITLLGGVAIVTMPVDIFPYIDIPVLSVVFNYGGLSPEEMANRVVTVFERSHHHHRQRHRAHRIAVLQRRLRDPHLLPARARGSNWRRRRSPPTRRPLCAACRPGIFPPNILKYDASSVPVLQLGLGSKTLSEQAALRSTARTSSEPSSRPFRALPFRCPMAANSGRSWSISIPTRCMPKASRPPTFRTR